jgi:glycosyltransferase involved in cell wall biosynthesis
MKVAFVGQMEYFRFHFEDDLNDLYEVKKIQLRWFDPPADYYEDLVAFRPDLTVVFRGEFLPTALLPRLSGIKIAISSEPMPKILDGKLVYTDESLERFRLFLGIVDKSFDFIFHHDQSSESFFQSQGVQLSGFIPLPIATGAYRPVATSPSHDILFLGRSTPHREAFLALLKREFDVLHIAHGFPGPKGVIERHFLPIVSSFHVALNIHPVNELCWEPRVQHMLACGILVVSERISPNPYLIAGRDFLLTTSPADLYEICRNILKDPAKYSHIRKSGLQQVQKQLSTRSVFPKLFNDIAAGAYRPPRFVPNLLRVEMLT